MQNKATATIFLFFSVVVAFINFMVGNYQYVIFCFPFIFSVLTNGKVSKASEILGLETIAIYLSCGQDVTVGMLVFIISTCIAMSSGISLKYSRFFIYFNALIIFVCSYLFTIQTASRLVHAALDSGIYAACSFCVYLSFRDHIVKYIDIMKESQKVAHKAVKMIKENGDGK